MRTSRRLGELTAGVAVLVLALAGCGGGDGAERGDGDATGEVDDEFAAEDALAGMLDENGVLPLDAALSIFALRYAPLPGVEPAEEPVLDGDYAVNVVALGIDELTPEQRAVVERILGEPGEPLDESAPPTSEDALGPADGMPPMRLVSLRQPIDRIEIARPILRDAIAYFSPKLGVTLDPSTIRLFEQNYANPDGTHNFSSLAEGAVTSYTGEFCQIRFNTDATYQEARFEAQVAHEAFHCLQHIYGDMSGLPLWIIEGSAAWAGEEYTGGTAQSGGTWWRAWITRPEWKLERRVYDAIGVYSLAQATGTDGYQLIQDLLDNPSYGTLVSSTSADFRNRWATHHFKRAEWGAAWEIRGPGVPAYPSEPTPLTLVVDAGPVRPPQPERNEHAARIVELVAPGDVLVVRVDGTFGGLRYGGERERFFGEAFNGGLCFRPDGCRCPGGPVPLPLERVNQRQVAIATFGRTGGGVEVESMSIERFCGVEVAPTTTTPGSTDGCVAGRWTSTRFALPRVPGSPVAPARGGSGVVVEFAPGGAFTIDFRRMAPLRSSLPAPAGTPPIASTLTFSGSASGTWSERPGGRISANVRDLGRIRILSTIRVGEATTTVLNQSLAQIAAAAGGGVGGGTFNVARCTGDSLQIRTIFTGGEAGIDLVRG